MSDKLPSIDDFYEELPSIDEIIKEEKELPSVDEFVETEEEVTEEPPDTAPCSIEEEAKSPTTVNNALFVGSTAELQKLLKKNTPK